MFGAADFVLVRRFATPAMNHDVERQGFAVVPGVIPADERHELLEALGPVAGPGDAASSRCPALPTWLFRRNYSRSFARICNRTRFQSELSASTGDVLLMRPWLLHASSRSTSIRHRQILHIEYAGFTLLRELEWHEAA
jgi:hypothetical protein